MAQVSAVAWPRPDLHDPGRDRRFKRGTWPRAGRWWTRQHRVRRWRAATSPGRCPDVFDDRPLPLDSPVRAMRNVILTRHVAGVTENSMLRMAQALAEERLRRFAGGLPRNFCNPQVAAHCPMRFAA